MTFRKTLVFSVFLHLCFLASAILISRDLFKNNIRIVKEEIFSVKLSEEVTLQTATETISKPKNEPRDIPQHPGHVPVVIIRKSKELWGSKPRMMPVFAGTAYIWEKKDDAVINTTEENTAANSALADTARVRDSIGNNAASEKTVALKGSLNAEIFELIRISIEKAKTYPVLARKKGLEGTVHVGFSITEQGEPTDIKILESSGSKILDEATLDIVKKAAPFPYVDMPVEVPVVYRLNQ